MIIDGHSHILIPKGAGLGTKGTAMADQLPELAQIVGQGKMTGLINAASITEFEAYIAVPGIYVSFGIHPWQSEEYADLEKISELEEFFTGADAVGEIGMDSVWCDCDLGIQRKVFEFQLDMAEALKKPIVLHTKGMELEIAEILEKYSMKKLVHWYGSDKHLDRYMDMNCYFTVSIDLKSNPIMQGLVEKVPVERLLVESDGTEAAAYMFNRKFNLYEIKDLLTSNMEWIAEKKGIDLKTLEIQMEENFKRFLEMD